MKNISVIVPIYNGEHEITRLLDALNAQSIDPSLVEYIMVNNNSKDRTRAVIEEYAKTARIDLKCVDENDIQGSYAARNKGIRAATGEILVFTDADCMPDKDWIKNLLPGFDDPEIGAVGGAINAAPGDTLLEEFATRRGVLSQETYFKHPHMPYFATANAAYRKDVFKKVGLFRPGLKTFGDADLCWRMQLELAYKLDYREDAIVLHKHRTNFADLYEQFERYGSSVPFFEQLYGYVTPREPRLVWYIRKFFVWAFFKYPVLLFKYLTGKLPKIEVYEEPIRIFIKWCSYSGTKRARKLGPLKNLDIEYLEA